MYAAPGWQVQVDANLQPVGAPSVTASADAPLSLVPAAIMSVLLQNIAPEQLPIVAET